MKRKAWFWTPYLLLRLHCNISDRENPEARVVRPMSIGPHSSAEAWNQQWSIHSHSQHDVFTVTLNRNDWQSHSTQSIDSQHKVLTVNTKYSHSTQSIDRQHKVFTVSGKGICQPVKPASGVSQYYVPWHQPHITDNQPEIWPILDRSRKSSSPKLGKPVLYAKGCLVLCASLLCHLRPERAFICFVFLLLWVNFLFDTSKQVEAYVLGKRQRDIRHLTQSDEKNTKKQTISRVTLL